MPPLIICNEEHRFAVSEQAAEMSKPVQPIILEPVGRNTAPALTVAALAQSGQGQDSILLMMPADHLIENQSAFHQALEKGIELVEDKFIVIFGVEPRQAETSYGYVERGDELKTTGSAGAFHVAGFTEKPDAVLAEKYIQSRKYLWNSGIFMVQSSLWVTAMKALQAEIYQACNTAYKNGERGNGFFRLAKQAFIDCPGDSVDYAVMEKLAETDDINAAVISLDAGWSDIGAWDKVWEHGATDENNNVKIGDVVAEDTTNSLIRSDKRLVTTVGCDNLAIIETADAVMVLNKDKSQNVRELVATLSESDRDELNLHQYVRRPWGGYETIEIKPGCQVKRLVIKPGKKISLQLHNKRSEHWVVIKGTATVTKEGEVFDLEVNESAFIPLGVKHRLENRTESVLEIIEVQVGEYVGEDDIVRFDDDFGRR